MIRKYQTITLLNALKQDIFNDDILYLKDVKIPNFFKIQDKNLQFEFCHQILELYEDYIFLTNLNMKIKKIILL